MGNLTRAEKKALKKQNSLLEVKDTCVNCDQYIALDQRFCAHCGGKRIYNKLTWRNLLEDFVDRFLNLENSFLKTFIAMFTKPEEVIGGYMNGMRKKYLPAFSYFAIAITVAGVYSFLLKNYFADSFLNAQIDASSMFSMRPEQAAMQKEFAEGWAKDWMDWATDYQSLLYFASIPILAVISRIVFWNYKKYNFVEHLVIYLYAYSHVAMITSVIYICFMWNATIFQILSFASMPLWVVYTAIVLKRLFKLDTGGIILKTGLFTIVSSVIMVGITLVVGAFFIIGAISGEPKDPENQSAFTKLMRSSFEMGRKMSEEKERIKDSIYVDSVLKASSIKAQDTLEVTPEMIKDSLE